MNRQDIIDHHVSNSQLNEYIDLSRNGSTSANTFFGTNTGINFADQFRAAWEDRIIRDNAYANDFKALNEKLIALGEPPLTDSEQEQLIEHGNYPPTQNIPLNDGVKSWEDLVNVALSAGADGIGHALGPIGDVLMANPELNFPAWMNGLMDMFDDSVDTPDPILTLRNIGMRGGDPLILDLNGDGVELVQLADSTARFDVNGDDFATPTGWVNANNGLLVLDKNRNGRIDSVNELFGNTAVTGFEELALCSDYLKIQFSKAA